MKKTLITGISGQDAAYLSKLLLDKGHHVVGGLRRNAERSLWRLESLGVRNDVEVVDLELTELSEIFNTIKKYKFDYIYNLAAMSFVGTSFSQPISTANTNYISVLNILESIRISGNQTRFYQASTSEMFGKVVETPQSESTPFYPRSPYGVSKLAAHWATINYRESFNMHACSGILFNHESPLRGAEFVTQKIILGLNDIRNKKAEKITLGNIDAKRDWGHAEDYVNAMRLIVENENPSDYVVATGELKSVREFIEIAGKHFDFDLTWEGQNENEIGIDKKSGNKIIEISKKYYRPAEVDLLIGSPKNIESKLGWKRKYSFNGLVEDMCINANKFGRF
jgi:GDPmannose 4,6-dehydratase